MIIRLLILMLFVAGCGGAAGVNPTSTSGPVSATEGVTLSTVVKAPATASASLSRSLKSVTNSVIPAQAGIPASRVSKATADISAIGAKCNFLNLDGSSVGEATADSSGKASVVVNPSAVDLTKGIGVECDFLGNSLKNFYATATALGSGGSANLGDTDAITTVSFQQALVPLGLKKLSPEFLQQVSSGSFQAWPMFQSIRDPLKDSSVVMGDGDMSQGAKAMVEAFAAGFGARAFRPEDIYDLSTGQAGMVAMANRYVPSVDFSKAAGHVNATLPMMANTLKSDVAEKYKGIENGFKNFGMFFGNQTADQIRDAKPDVMKEYFKTQADKFSSEGSAAFSTFNDPAKARVMAGFTKHWSSGSTLDYQALESFVDSASGLDASKAGNYSELVANQFKVSTGSTAKMDILAKDPGSMWTIFQNSGTNFLGAEGQQGIENLILLKMQQPTFFTGDALSTTRWCSANSNCLSGEICGDGRCLSSTVSVACKADGCPCDSGDDCDTGYCKSDLRCGLNPAVISDPYQYYSTPTVQMCSPTGQYCDANANCCSGYCNSHICSVQGIIDSGNSGGAVTLVSPVPSATGIGVSQTVRIRFYMDVSPASITSQTFQILQNNVAAAGGISFNSSTREATFTPSSPLQKEKTYTVRVSGVNTGYGYPVPDSSWSFATELNNFTCALSPINGASNIATNVTPTLVCSHALASYTFSESCGGAPQAGTVALSNSNKTATLTITDTSGLASQACTITAINSIDVNGRLVSSLQSNFTYGLGADNTAPTFAGSSGCVADSATAITCSWTAATDDSTAQGSIVYDVYRATSSGAQNFASATAATAAGAVNYQSTGLSPLTQYFFVVRARDATGNRDANVVERSATTILAAPTNFAAVAGNAQCDLTWTKSTGATGYKVFRSTSSGFTAEESNRITTTGDVAAYSNTSLTNGTTYYYKLAATSAGGDSSVTAQVSCAPVNPTPYVYAATAGGLSISTDGGATFTNKVTGSTNGVFVSGTNVYAATAGGLSISTDGGSTFANKTTANGLGSNTVFGVFASGTNVYAATFGGLSISTDGGATFANKTTANGLGNDYVRGHLFASGTNVYAATNSGVSISTDSGSTFTNKTTANGLGGNTVRGVFVSGTNVYAATSGGVSTSTDGGSTFTNKTTANGLGSNDVRDVFVAAP